jgi:hypothetical protein
VPDGYAVKTVVAFGQLRFQQLSCSAPPRTQRSQHAAARVGKCDVLGVWNAAEEPPRDLELSVPVP